ncbi:MAG TPA: hypothetical protein VG734_21845 [Lacunisphaera sp.]|nr:hypothetical protein [Lacunisphaera sp.]
MKLPRLLGWLVPLLPLGVGLGAGERAPPPPDEGIYELPPFVTYGYRKDTNWRYAEIPGFEVLSQCSDRETRAIVGALWRGRQLVLPEAMRPHFSLPMTVVLYNQPGSAGGDLPSFGNEKGKNELTSHWKNLIKRTLEDRESFALNLWPGSFDYSASFRYDLFTLLRRRVPEAPTWLEEGLFGSYGVYREGVFWNESRSAKAAYPSLWCSVTEGEEAIRMAAQAHRQFAGGKRPTSGSSLLAYIPELPALFEQPPPKDDTAWDRWAATVALFIRWGTYDCPPTQVEQFWRFAGSACSEGVTETLFKECFGGRSYRDVQIELSWYLPIALKGEGKATASDVAPLPKFALTDATPAQIARVRGEWERMEAAALAPHFPKAAAKYRELAARTLTQPAALSDVRVQASLGLLALEQGELAKARTHLEKAVAGKAAGPRPYFELARLRWEADRLGGSGKLPPEKLTEVIDLILAAERQQPSLAAVYLLLAEALKQVPTPTGEQRAALERGRQLFPRHAAVQAALARLGDTAAP